MLGIKSLSACWHAISGLKTCFGKKLLYIFGTLTYEQSSCDRETLLLGIFTLSSVLLILKYLL